MDMALGCSTNTTLHLPALFAEAGLDLNLEMFNEISKKHRTCAIVSGWSAFHGRLNESGGIPA